MENKTVLPMVALRGLVIFPYMVLHFDIGREKSIEALENSMENGQDIFLVAQRDIKAEEPSEEEIYEVGTVSRIKQVLKLPGDNIRVLVEGVNRGRILRYLKTEPFYQVEIENYETEETAENDLVKEAYMRRIYDMFEKFAGLGTRMSGETLLTIADIKQAGKFADLVASNVVIKMEDKQAVLESIDELERLKRVMQILSREIEILEIDREISASVKQQVDKSQRDYFLREQMKAIQKELGESENDISDMEEIREKIKTLPLSDEAREKAEKELSRLAKTPHGSPEASVSRNYLDWIVSLPWGVYTEDNLDLDHVRDILEEDHYGLEKVKDRVVEFLAVRKLKDSTKGPIICFAGPPGVGKTSIARSIARAIDKKFVRMSLGGVRDEAEIRGHRRTYIGAVPGRIITSIKQAGSMNPLFLLDEIDKMSSDFRGDPAAAMLEVLDPEINNTFADHYLDMGFDLSKVMFITTANDVDAIPEPLYDRMEIIYINSYTDVEKLNIAKLHLLKKQAEEHGLSVEQVKVPDNVIMDIIHKYTAEAGVRSLERQIAAIMRKAATQIVKNELKQVVVNRKNLKNFLGLAKRTETDVLKVDTVGVVTGLAWTSVGGQTLAVEVSAMEGTGKLELTGQLGDVMKESARAGFSLVRALAHEYKIPADINEKVDIHIHLPEGAIPKDGPSAGITMVTAMVSALTGLSVRCDIAMTGEITLTGRVLKIGGLKEKSLAALRAGIRNIILPEGNRADIEELPDNVRRKLTFYYVSNIKEVLDLALLKPPKKGKANGEEKPKKNGKAAEDGAETAKNQKIEEK